MNTRDWQTPFRIGATSYIVESDLPSNARFLAPHVQDMQLVLFDIAGGPSNFPDAGTVAALAEIGARHDLTFTVHLIEDLAVAEDAAGSLHPSLRSAQRLIARTQALTPHAWVGHLDGREVRALNFPAEAMRKWHAQAICAVKHVGEWVGDAQQLAIENLEGYPADFVAPVAERGATGRCVDVGHLWLDGRDPLDHLCAAWPQLRVVHLHGVLDDLAQPNRDHRSLAVMAPTVIDSVVHYLLRHCYSGVLTLEIFGEADFWSSLDALYASIRRYQGD